MWQVRVYRIQRDIPMPLVTSGVEKGNLRELAMGRMRDMGLACRDVRSREAGIQDIHNQVLARSWRHQSQSLHAQQYWSQSVLYADAGGRIGCKQRRAHSACSLHGSMQASCQLLPWPAGAA